MTKGRVDRSEIKVGDVLGVDFELPSGLEHLNGWEVFDVRDGVPHVLQPKTDAPESRMSLRSALEYVEEVRASGHERVRLWTEGDASAIYRNIVKADYARAQCEGIPSGRFWGDPPEESLQAQFSKMHYPGDDTWGWEQKERDGDVRLTQSVPELVS